ncbi:MAG: VCBS repeat-containing protein [Deltaproteobacteria bacterium]|nr:VCBS repeat-containing protein [Deltaproteobacteria bacterium]
MCDTTCCGDTEVCSFQTCVPLGDECTSTSQCPDGEYCELPLGEPDGAGMCGGNSLATGRCLPLPDECPAEAEPTAGDCLHQCEVTPQTSFEPVLKYHWDSGDILAAPIVIQLDDDNCDGIVDERDIPEIVFTSTPTGMPTELTAISIVEGQLVEKWSVAPDVEGVADSIGALQSIAAGNIDGIPGNEIITCTAFGGRARAYDHNGSELWLSESVGCTQPSIADIDQDGTVEVITNSAVLDGVTGAVEINLPVGFNPTTSDVDGDNILELVGPSLVHEADGTLLATLEESGFHVAVADIDGDGSAEIATTFFTNSGSLTLWRVDPAAPSGASVIRSYGDQAGCPGGGPPTIADFNGDGTPDVGATVDLGFVAYDGAALMNPAIPDAQTQMWMIPRQSCNFADTGASAFDFDGNGSAEVLYADDQVLRILDGTTGAELFQTCNINIQYPAYPVVADVDGDGHADVLAVSTGHQGVACPDGSLLRGLRIFGDDQWVRTGSVWNQHDYRVTNVEDDGTIPTVETTNWTVEGLNSFRHNVLLGGQFAAPDLVATLIGLCSPTEFGVTARVRNVGRATVPAGVPVGFYEGDPATGGTLLGTALTSRALDRAEAEDLTLMLPDASAELVAGDVDVWIVVDDGPGDHAWQECRPGNNTVNGPIACGVVE